MFGRSRRSFGRVCCFHLLIAPHAPYGDHPLSLHNAPTVYPTCAYTCHTYPCTVRWSTCFQRTYPTCVPCINTFRTHTHAVQSHPYPAADCAVLFCVAVVMTVELVCWTRGLAFLCVRGCWPRGDSCTGIPVPWLAYQWPRHWAICSLAVCLVPVLCITGIYSYMPYSSAQCPQNGMLLQSAAL